MVKDSPPTRIELLLNESVDSHGQTLKSLLCSAQHFVCMTAFAKKTGLKLIQKDLKDCLIAGLDAKFVIGLNFYQTDPSVLDHLSELSEQYALTLLVSRPPWHNEDSPAKNFHPKVFVFKSADATSVMIGSANLTGGGLMDNHEASVLIHDGSSAVAKRLDLQIEQLTRDKEVVLADANILREYARRHAIYKVHDRLTKWRIKRAFQNDHGLDIDVLKGYLVKMKSDTTENGFAAQMTYRRNIRTQSQKMLTRISKSPPLSKSGFLKLYEPLVAEFWHSGGLQRGKNAVAAHAQAFQGALRSLKAIKTQSVEEAFDVLHRNIQVVRRAGVNVITEILHSSDNLRFAVMNQNSVSGLALAGITGFPTNPTKNNVGATMYADFCVKARDVRNRLGLKDFTELDALLNYAYWDN